MHHSGSSFRRREKEPAVGDEFDVYISEKSMKGDPMCRLAGKICFVPHAVVDSQRLQSVRIVLVRPTYCIAEPVRNDRLVIEE